MTGGEAARCLCKGSGQEGSRNHLGMKRKKGNCRDGGSLFVSADLFEASSVRAGKQLS
ncbi:hypothetical protein YDYSY3_14870 [Paenibacillus chitinolyticus]|nr:hypothetical protein YDYSY3_14870 [Paenibacillus chitinolyticus]